LKKAKTKLEADNKNLKSQLEQLRKASTSSITKELQTLNRDLKKANFDLENEKHQLENENQQMLKNNTTRELADLSEEKECKDECISSMNDELKQRQHRSDELNRLVKKLTAENEQLQEHLAQALDAIKDTGKTHPAEQSQNIKKKIKHWVHTVAW
jgi:chromosome segregation ATPase